MGVRRALVALLVILVSKSSDSSERRPSHISTRRIHTRHTHTHAYGVVVEGPTRFGRRVPGDAQVKDPNGIGPCDEQEIRTAFGAGMWGGKLPNTWEVIDAEMYAILAYLRKMASAMASASEAQTRWCF